MIKESFFSTIKKSLVNMNPEKFKFSRPNHITLAVNTIYNIEDDSFQFNDEDLLNDVHTTFETAFNRGLVDYNLSSIDAKKLCNLYVNRSVLKSYNKENFSPEFDEYLFSYIKVLLPQILSYAINLYIQAHNFTEEYVQRFGNLILNCLAEDIQDSLIPWKESAYIFTNEASQTIANLYFEIRDFEKLLLRLPFSNESQLHSRIIFDSIKRIFVSSQLTTVEVVNALKDVFKNDRYKEILPETINLICHQEGMTIREDINEIPSKYDEGINQMVGFLINSWGNPKDSNFNSDGWRHLDEEVLRYFRFKFAQTDFDLFLAVLSKCHNSTMWKYREKFWSAYLKYVVRSKVFLTASGQNEASKLIQGQFKNNLSYGKISDDKSMIIFEFENFCVVEWSHFGKVTFLSGLTIDEIENIFNAQEIVEIEMKRPGVYYSVHNVVDSVVHDAPMSYGWQQEVEKILKDKFNLLPTHSYRLDQDIR